VPSRHSTFRLCDGNEQDQALNLKPREWEILSLIDGNRSVNEVNDMVGEDLFTTSKLIYGLVVMGVIELVADEEEAAGESAANEERIEELIRNGRNYYSRLNLEKAAAEFEKALQIDQDCFEALRMLGEIYYKMDRLSEALVYLRKARGLRPNNQKTMFIKGYLHARLGEVENAISEWEELREKSANAKILDLVKRRISVAREWEKVLQEY
jgi:tetratricopeptide (TPR) repeat protein